MDINNNKTFCVLPWVHTHLNTEGDVFPCCISWDTTRRARVGWLKDNTLEELFNNDFMKQLRLDMLGGVERPDVCTHCYDREAGGFKSARQGYNDNYQHKEIQDVIESTAEDGYVEPIIKSWDIRFSNLCNLKCRTCGPLFSTTWAQEQKEFDFIKIHAIHNDVDPLINQYDNVKQLYFAGGEPLIMPEHFRTLTELISRGRASDIQIIYNSNMTKLDYNNHDLVGYWKNFRKVVIGLSIDAVGPRAEYIRNGVPWKTIEGNIRKLKEFKKQCSTFDFYFSPTVSALNVHHICDMHRYLWENDLMPYIGSMTFNMLLHPVHYDCRILPRNIKDNIIEKITNHITWLLEQNCPKSGIEQYENLKTYLEQDLAEIELLKFLKKTKDLDEVRNESFINTFPEYSTFYKEYEKLYYP